MNSYIYLIILIAIGIGLLLAIKLNEGFSMNLGNYGQVEPESCYENSTTNAGDCRACSLRCADPTNCYECKRKMMCTETTPGIREIPDTAGKQYIACNACHLSCPDPENCFECQKKMNLEGVL